MTSIIPPIIVTMAMVAFSGIAIFVGIKKNETPDTIFNVLFVFAVISTFYFGWTFTQSTGLTRAFGLSGGGSGMQPNTMFNQGGFGGGGFPQQGMMW